MRIVSMILSRLGFGLITLLIISIIVFFSIELLPGDLAQELLGQSATPETVAALRIELGLDKPPLTRYLGWLGDVIRLDFGKSLANGADIGELIGERLANTLFLACVAALIAVPLSLFVGIASALFRDSIFDRLVNMVSLAAISMPEFFFAYIMVSVFAVKLGWFSPVSNFPRNADFLMKLNATWLPALTLSAVVIANMMRMTRASIVSLMASSYIEMAELKGLSPARIIMRHALPNALTPIINVVSLTMAYLIVGVVIVEFVFVYPGLGQLMVNSVAARDVTVIQACCLIFAATYICLNLIADVLSIATNPRLLHPS